MNNSKLISVLQSLTNYEINQFRDYVHSPYFNKNQALTVYIEYLLNQYPSFIEDNLNKKHIHKELFRNETYREQRMSDLATFALRLVNGFLIQKANEKNVLTQKLSLLSELRERRSSKNYLSLETELDQVFNSTTECSTESYKWRSDFYNEADLFALQNNPRKASDSLQKKSDNSDVFFIASKLKEYCEMLNRKNIIQVSFDTPFINDLLVYLEREWNRYANIPVVQIYYAVYKTLTEPDKEIHYQKLCELAINYSSNFSKTEARYIYDYAQNYCIRKINKGVEKYYSELFSLYKQLLLNKLIYESKYLSPWDYKNIITVGLRVGDHEWIKKFIDDYKNELPPAERENAYVYNKATYELSVGSYRSALKLLQQVEFSDVFYHLGAKSMQLRMYYELEESDQFYSLCDTFKMYLLRNKDLSKAQQEGYLNFLKFAKKLFKIREQGANKNQSQLAAMQLVLKEKNTSNLKWINEQLEALKMPKEK